MAHAGGRPLIQLTDLPTDYEQLIIREMSIGASLQEIYGWLNISEPTFKRLCRDHPEFARTIKTGLRLSEKWWLQIGRTHIRDKEFNSTLWYMNMKNRFGWRDKVETETVVKDHTVSVHSSKTAQEFTEFLKTKKK